MKGIKILCFLDEEGPSKLQDSIIKELKQEYKNINFSLIDAKNDGELVVKYSIKEYPSIIIESEKGVEARFSGLTQQLFIKRAIDRLIK